MIFHLARLPTPELQFSVFTHDGRFVGRSDFGWPEFGVLGEFDGKSKYGELLRKPGQSAEQVLVAEKRREDRLRELGWMVIRWMWQDLMCPESLIGRLPEGLHPRTPGGLKRNLHRHHPSAPSAMGAGRRKQCRFRSAAIGSAVGVENESHRPVVDQADLHLGAEDPGGNLGAELTESGDERLDQRFADGSGRGGAP